MFGSGTQLGVEIGEGAVEAHVVIADGLAAPGEIVEQRFRLGILAIVVPAEVPQRRRPFAMRSLVLAHQQERFRLVAVLQPLDRQVGDDVGHVARVLHLLAVPDHRRVVVHALPRQDVPVIEAGRIADQMPFADQGRRVAGLLQQLGKRLLRAVETAVAVVVEAVDVRVLAGQDRRPARPADRVRHEAAIKPHPFARDPIHVRRGEQLATLAVGADRLAGQIVGEDEQDVGRADLRPPAPVARSGWS